MGITELLLIGVGLSMDAFAVAICQGLSMSRLNWRHAGVIGLYFWTESAWRTRPGRFTCCSISPGDM